MNKPEASHEYVLKCDCIMREIYSVFSPLSSARVGFPRSLRPLSDQGKWATGMTKKL